MSQHLSFRRCAALTGFSGILGFVAMLSLFMIGSRPVNSAPAILYVAPGGNCGTLSPCYGGIQAAIDAASTGDEIRVAGGRYTDVQNRSGVAQVAYIDKTIVLRGGYSISDWDLSNPALNVTIVDAHGSGRGIYVVGDIYPVLEGLYITGGKADQGSETSGGGIYIRQATVTIRNNFVVSNTAGEGGGIYLEGGSSSLVGNTIISNTAPHGWGGGINLRNSPSTISNNVISNNTAEGAAGGIGIYESDATVVGNTIDNNGAQFSGGALYLHYSNALIDGNHMSGNGAHNAVLLWHSDAVVSANVIRHSESGIFLHASAATIANNFIADHTYSGVHADGASPRLFHNTIVRNNSGVQVTDRWQDGLYYSSTVALTNTILADLSVGVYAGSGTAVDIDGVLWDKNSVTTTHALTATVTVQNQHYGDPMFASDGFHLAPTSPAVDRGRDVALYSDIDGNYRPYNTAPDLGADEVIAVTAAQGVAATLTYTDPQDLVTELAIPSNAVTDSVVLEYVPVDDIAAPPHLRFANKAFDLNAYEGGALVSEFAFAAPISITIQYTDTDISGVDDSTLVLYYWNEDLGGWEDVATTCQPPSTYQHFTAEYRFTVPVCHLSRFAVFGGSWPNEIFLPSIMAR